MKGSRIILIHVSDFLFRPFYKHLFFFPFDINIGKYPIYKQMQYLHFRITRKYRQQKEVVKIRPSKNCGFYLELNPGKDFHQMHLFMAHFYEKNMTESLLKDLKTADIFFDIGSYIGYYCLMVRLAFADIKIYAFEPQLKAFQLLQKNMERNSQNFNVYNCALGDINEDKLLNINRFPEQSSLLMSDALTDEKYVVRIKKLDNLLNFKAQKIVVKIDTEGYEFEVMKGMSEIIEKNECVIYFEYNPKIYIKQFGGNYSLSLFQFLNERGYNVFEIKNNGKKQAYFYNVQSLLQQNLMAIKER